MAHDEPSGIDVCMTHALAARVGDDGPCGCRPAWLRRSLGRVSVETAGGGTMMMIGGRARTHDGLMFGFDGVYAHDRFSTTTGLIASVGLGNRPKIAALSALGLLALMAVLPQRSE